MAEWTQYNDLETPEAADQLSDPDGLWLAEDDLTQGEKAADYLRGLDHQEILADYVEKHYDDSLWDFSPDLPIPITTRNMDLEGECHPSGVEFTRQEVDMGDGVTISGVFPEFESRFDTDLGDEANAILKAEEPNKSIASWAIRFAASKEGVLTVLSGMSNMEQLRDNIATTTDFKALTDAENEMLFKAAKVYSKNLAVPCTGCRYCMDCPMGVDIPKAFVKWNNYAKSLDKWNLCDEYNQLRKDKCAPDQCVSCGKCAEHCPQHIDIPARLAEMTAKVNS